MSLATMHILALLCANVPAIEVLIERFKSRFDFLLFHLQLRSTHLAQLLNVQNLFLFRRAMSRRPSLCVLRRCCGVCASRLAFRHFAGLVRRRKHFGLVSVIEKTWRTWQKIGHGTEVRAGLSRRDFSARDSCRTQNTSGSSKIVAIVTVTQWSWRRT